MSSPPSLTIAEAAASIAKKETSPVELVRAYLDRIATFDPTYRAFLHLSADDALDDARGAEAEIVAGRYRGPLHGIPLALKDIVDTAGVVTTAGSRLWTARVPTRDAHCWHRLKDAGAILLGKLETHEFGIGGPRRIGAEPYAFSARNPWDVRRYTGGSSSGPASAVTAGLCMGGVGTDSTGSIIVPAAYCGLFGLKPTAGLVSRSGIAPLSSTLDRCGPMTWTAEDAAHMLGAMAAHDAADPASLGGPVPDYAGALREDLAGMRIGLVHREPDLDPQPSEAVHRALEAAVSVLRALGAEVVDLRLPALGEFSACNLVILLAESFAVHRRDLADRGADYDAVSRDRLLLGALISAADYLDAQRLRRRLTAQFDHAVGTVDAVVGPATPTSAPDLEEVAHWDNRFSVVGGSSFDAPFTAAGAPVAAVCCGFDADGLPIAMQVGAARGRDATVLRLAHAYERASGWRDRRPVS